MPEVTIRELRNQGGGVVDRVARGERLTITRSGRPVAELAPVRKPGVSLEAAIASRRWLPYTDPSAWRRDVSEVVDGSRTR
jgi:prevent-host-death family protein